MKCNVCDNESIFIFKSKILNKYSISYFHCNNCGFLQTEKPYWLEKAYKDAINVEDTGILRRNFRFRNMTSIIISTLFSKNGKFLDYGGGHGIFTRLMRDLGYDFYWMDKYAENIFARGFEYDCDSAIDLITCFESFEHFQEPLTDIDRMLSISKNILFSTELLPDPIPKPSDWWYYGLSHGQHISFYSPKSLKYIATYNGLNFYSFGDIHILTKIRIRTLRLKILEVVNKLSFFEPVKIKIGSKTIDDMNYIISLRKDENL